MFFIHVTVSVKIYDSFTKRYTFSEFTILKGPNVNDIFLIKQGSEKMKELCPSGNKANSDGVLTEQFSW